MSNPYQTPTDFPTLRPPQLDGPCYRDGELLVVREGSVQLPPYCIFSGVPVSSAPAIKTLKYIRSSFWLQIYVPTVSVQASLAPSYNLRMFFSYSASALGVLLGIMMFIGIIFGLDGLFGMISVLFGIVMFQFGSFINPLRRLRASRADAGLVWIKGAGLPFLDRLPDLEQNGFENGDHR